MKPSVIIIGTNHFVQTGEARYSAAQRAAFSNVLLKAIKKYRIKLIAEEMSEDALSDYGVTQTLAKGIANSTEIGHSYIELTAPERRAMGINRLNLHQAAQSSGLSPAQACTLETLIGQVRETVWLLRILQNNTWPVLLICGANNGNRMEYLFNSIGKLCLLEVNDYDAQSAAHKPE